MAKIIMRSPRIAELSGKVGDVVFYRSQAGRTMMRARPRKPTHPSEKQQHQQRRFQQATAYASEILKDPALRAIYEKRAKAGQSAYNAAIADYFSEPAVDQIHVDNYLGNVGDLITIEATDKSGVRRVMVSITLPDGTEGEKGDAFQVSGNIWLYTAKMAQPVAAGTTITATAVDLPGHETSASVTIEADSIPLNRVEESQYSLLTAKTTLNRRKFYTKTDRNKIKKLFKIGRDAGSGRFIKVEEARKRPKTTTVETMKRRE